MESTVDQFPPHRETAAHHAHEEHGHHDPGFLRSYVFSTDHKVIGIQYGLTALFFLLFGFFLMLLMRWQIAHPGQPVPFLGPLLEKMLGPTIFSISGPNNGTGNPGCAICQRISSIRKNPNSMKHSAVKPYWMPMTLWSVEKIYLLQKLGS